MRILILLFFLPIFGFGQYTYVPDDNFEQKLINLGYDFIFDDQVLTANIDTVTQLEVYNLNISDLTGVEDFISLRALYCGNNNLTSLDLSNNPDLYLVNCQTNSLTYIDVRNGNNQNIWGFTSMFNPSLNCIDVDDVAYANYAWTVDSWTTFSNNCNPSTSIFDVKNTKRKLLRVVDLLGNNVQPRYNVPLLYIYSDGTVEKKMFLE